MTDVLWTNSGKANSAVGTATISAATDLLTITDHGLGDGGTVTVDTLTGGGSALTENAVYFVRDATDDTFRLTLTLHGPPVDFTSDGGADVYRWSPGLDAQELRRANAVGLFPGVVDEFGARPGVRPHSQVPLSVSGSTWTQHNITTVVQGAGSGPYQVPKAEQSGQLDPADGSLDRIDAVDLRVRDDHEDASGFREADTLYVPGVPAASPSPEPVTANSLRLGTILVPSGGSPAPSVQTLAPWLAIGIVPVRDTTELPTAGLLDGMTAYDQLAEAMRVREDGAWPIVASPNPAQMVVFTANGSFDKANFLWAKWAWVRVQADGGAGGGAPATASGESSLGTGGGSGGYAESILPMSALLASEPVTVGQGGATGVGGTGGSGTGASFGTHVAATGGAGGGVIGARNTAAAATTWGAGGTATAGQIQVDGAPGNSGVVITGSVAMSGAGANSVLGLGGNSRGTGTGATSQSGTGGRLGGGGGGAVNGSAASALGGGAGGPAEVIVVVF